MSTEPPTTDEGMVGTAARAWAAALEGWRIPDEILAAAPESPWQLPPSLFAYHEHARPSPTHARVEEALPQGGTLLDVGAGGGAASLPMASRASRIVAVDSSAAMLERFAADADAAGVAHVEVSGGWPDVADAVEVADVAVCANVVYNVADIVPFIAALVTHARRRVVLEATVSHPLVATAELWDRFHPSAPRPRGPGVEDLVAVLAEMGIAAQVERFSRTRLSDAPRADYVVFVRRRLCVGADRDAEIDAWLGDPPVVGGSDLATLWWDV